MKGLAARRLFSWIARAANSLKTAAYLLQGKGYSVNITDKVQELSAKRVMLGAVYVSLDWLETRGLLFRRRSRRQT